MAIGTPVNSLAGATVNATTQVLSIPIISAGRIIIIQSHARRGSATLVPDDPTLADSSGAPLTWTPIFSPIPVQSGANPGTKAQWWWAISDGLAKTVTLTWGNAASIFSSQMDVSIGAGMLPNFSNQIFGGNTGTGAITATLPTSPTAGINILSFYGAGGSNSTIASGFTTITSIASTPYRTGYDLTPIAATVMGSTFVDQILAVANLVEVAAGVTVLAIAGHAKIHGYVGVVTVSDNKTVRANAAGHALLHGYIASVTASDNKLVRAIAGHIRLHGYQGVIGNGINIRAIAGHALLHGYIGRVVATANQIIRAIAGHARIHGYVGRVVATDTKIVRATAGHAKLHGYTGRVLVTDTKIVRAIAGHIRIHGYQGFADVGGDVEVFATSGHIRLHGYPCRVYVFSYPDEDRIIRVPKELRTIQVPRGDRTIKAAAEYRIIKSRPQG